MLEKETDGYLLLSKDGLDVHRYHGKNKDVIWESCDLRRWLNSEFMNNAFSKEERSRVVRVMNKNAENEGFEEDNVDRSTEDSVFLLNADEASKLFKDNSARRCHASGYAELKNAWVGNNNCCQWWLRSRCDKDENGNREALIVYVDGSFDTASMMDKSVCVRPALWVSHL